MITISTDIPDTTVRLRKFAASISGSGRQSIFNRAANRVEELVRRHLQRLNSWKHKTANDLGAQPTGHIEMAARGAVHHATQDHGEVVIPEPGFSRAFHDVFIKPKNWRYLTLPADAVSYGKRASVVASEGWTLYAPPNRHFIIGRKKGEGSKILYWLRESVHQKQDRSLLPSDAEINAEAAAGAMSALAMIQRRAS